MNVIDGITEKILTAATDNNLTAENLSDIIKFKLDIQNILVAELTALRADREYKHACQP